MRDETEGVRKLPRPGGFPDPEFRWALGFVRAHAHRLVLVVLLGLVGTGISLFLPYLSKLLVDDALVAGSRASLLRLIVLFLGLTAVGFVVSMASGLRYNRVSADVLFEMRLALYRHLQRLSPGFYTRTPLGEIVSRLNSDLGEIQRIISESALAWIGHVLFLAGAVGVMVWLDWRLFLVSLLLLPASLWALVLYRRRLEVSIAELRQTSSAVGSFMIETIQAIRLVTSANAQDREIQRFRDRNDAFVSALMRMQWLRYLSGGLPGLLLTAGGTVVLFYGGSRVIDGSLTLGTFVAFMAYQVRLASPIQGLMGLYANLAVVRVSLRRVHELLDAPVEVVERPLPVVPIRGGGSVVFEGVDYGFGRGEPVLRGVDLRVEPGETVAIVGESGSGKSTIADLLVRNVDPQGGRVLLDGQDLRDLQLSSLRRLVFVVDQEPFLFHASLLENVRYARPEASQAEVEAVLEQVGLGPFVRALPQGIETAAGERGRGLSVGERQRISIARALLVDPSVLILDESTAALDPATEGRVVRAWEEAARQLPAGRTTILITHRRELAMRADRVAVLLDGRIVEGGTPQALLEREGAFARLMRTA